MERCKNVFARITGSSTNLYRFHQDLDKAQSIGEKAIALSRELGLDELLAYCLTDAAHTYNMVGQVGKARDISLEAVDLWRKSNAHCQCPSACNTPV